MRASQNWVNESLHHIRKDSILDFSRGEVHLRIGRNDYTAQIIVGNHGKDGLLLYDIINLSPISIQSRPKKTSADRYTANAQSEPRSSQSALIKNIIPQPADESKPQFSLKGTEDAQELAKLVQKNRELERRLEYWRQKASPANAKHQVLLSQVRQTAGEFLKTWQSPLKVTDVQPRVLHLWNLIQAGPGPDASTAQTQTWTAELEQQAREIAGSVIQSVVTLDENDETRALRQLRQELKEAQISYEEEKKEIPDFEQWRRRNQFRMGLRKNGRSIDSYWEDWAERFGEAWFPRDIVSTTDMLLHLESVLDSTQPAYENPFDGYDVLEVTEDCKNYLIDSIIRASDTEAAPEARKKTPEELRSLEERTRNMTPEQLERVCEFLLVEGDMVPRPVFAESAVIKTGQVRIRPAFI